MRYNTINMINVEVKQDIGYVTIPKRKLRQLVEAISAGATVEQVKAELEKLLAWLNLSQWFYFSSELLLAGNLAQVGNG